MNTISFLATKRNTLGKSAQARRSNCVNMGLCLILAPALSFAQTTETPKTETNIAQTIDVPNAADSNVRTTVVGEWVSHVVQALTPETSSQNNKEITSQTSIAESSHMANAPQKTILGNWVHNVISIFDGVSPGKSEDEYIAEINSLTNTTPTAAGIPLSLEDQDIADHDKAHALPPKTMSQSDRKKLERSSQGNISSLSWNIERPLAAGAFCHLTTNTIQIDQNGYSTQLWFDVTDHSLSVNTSMNLDIHHPDSGILTDQGYLYSFSETDYGNRAIWHGDVDTLLKSGNDLIISLARNETGIQLQAASLKIKALKRAYNRCQSKELALNRR